MQALHGARLQLAGLAIVAWVWQLGAGALAVNAFATSGANLASALRARLFVALRSTEARLADAQFAHRAVTAGYTRAETSLTP